MTQVKYQKWSNDAFKFYIRYYSIFGPFLAFCDQSAVGCYNFDFNNTNFLNEAKSALDEAVEIWRYSIHSVFLTTFVLFILGQ